MKPAISSPAGAPVKPPISGLSPNSYAYLQRLVLAESGIALDEGKQYLIEARLRPILHEHGFRSLDELTSTHMSRSPARLTKSIVEAMTTNETLFFRDTKLFDALRQIILPELIKRVGSTRSVRIWSAAASTGQEAYSLAVLLQQLGRGYTQVEILATDISEQVLARAKEGRYLQCEVNRGLTPELLQRYFTLREGSWFVKEDLRRMVKFQQWDLRKEPAVLGCFDLILCRNVLIYFNRDTKQKILQSLGGNLYPGGSVILGCAETTLDVAVKLERRAVGSAALYQRVA